MRKTILHIVQSAGGVEKYLFMLFTNMRESNYNNVLVCSKDYNVDQFIGITSSIEVIDMKREINISDIIVVYKLLRLIKKYSPEIIYLHSSKAGATGRIANMFMKKKCIYNPHGWSFNMGVSKRKILFYSIIEKILSSFCNKIVAISEFEKNSAIDRSIGKFSKILIIRNGIDIGSYEYQLDNSKITRSSIGISDESYIIGMVCRISHGKSPDIFLESAKMIKDFIPNAHFIIVGDGELRDEISMLGKRLGLDKSLTITGWTDNTAQYVKLFDVAVLLSRWEGFGLVLSEYMIAKKPIIATNVGAIPEIIKDGETGLLVNVDSVSDFTHRVLEIYNDKDLGKKMSRNGYLSAKKNYCIDRVVKEHLDLYDSLTMN